MKKVEEKRKFIRLQVPIEIKYIVEGAAVRKQVTTKDVSCEGLRFTTEEGISEGSLVELSVAIPKAPNPVHMNGRVVWTKRHATEDISPLEVGVEFIKIEEDNKNTFLKYLCDLIYDQTKLMGRKEK